MSIRSHRCWNVGRSARVCALALATALALGAGAWAQAAEIAITQPTNEQTIHSNLGEVMVSVQVSDATPDSRVRLSVDGHAQPSGGGSMIALRGLDRGTHVLKAELLAADGEVIATSLPVTIYLWHASSRNPHRAK
ncbi:hypothetical protein ACFOHU_01575 [Ottowia pentelensis]|uniref:Copper resistance protein CopC n=1 Tax=Ottowia pentelensis TaxID=511108 RepID=A0ABV6PNX4_9BURK